MLAARDQENRVFGGTVAGGKHHNALNPKTPAPGGKGAQTPFKGKSVLGGRPGNENAQNLQRTVGKGKGLVTPLEPRTAARAPLGNKTTNAKAMQSQMQQQQTQKGQKPQTAKSGVKDIVNQFEQTSQQQAPASGRRARVLSPRTNLTNSTKLSVLSDQSASASTVRRVVPDVEYCPPPVAPAKYESDVFPEGVLTFAAFKPENRLRGYYEHYFINKNNPVDETDGVPLRDKAMAERQRKAFEKLDIQVQKDLEEFDWAALSEANTKAAASKAAAAAAAKPSQPPTIALRNAASALALGSKKTIRAPSAGRNAVARPKMASVEVHTQSAAAASSVSSSLISGLPLRKTSRPASAMPIRTKPSTAANLAAESASRTTLGYNKGRTALSMVRGGANSGLNANTFVNPSTTRESAPSKLRSVASQPAIKRFVPSTEIASLDTSSIDVPSTPVTKSHLAMSMEGPTEERSPAFLSIFEVDENDMHHDEDEDDDIVPNDEEVTLGMGGRSGTFGNLGFDDQDDFQMDANFD
ncbi:hypothetical protein F503_02140 [Ophiostoma piceae UAMH 11346]|uniref:Uncharacterized protein n=1 Tax=Ophiostoma piceae (strain UAMH 11346) TaxID=1262450 RepID=S3C112_OPHP1|nr:hypothetical protein F503_02140 [Ophiostoma piceae UAMH 11346]